MEYVSRATHYIAWRSASGMLDIGKWVKHMSEWMKGIKWGNVCVSAVFSALAMVAIRQVEAMATMRYYLDPE